MNGLYSDTIKEQMRKLEGDKKTVLAQLESPVPVWSAEEIEALVEGITSADINTPDGLRVVLAGGACDPER